MTHLTPGGAGTAARPALFSTAQSGLLAPQTTRGRLDRAGLCAGIARRRQTFADLETGLVIACEQAAARGAAHAVRIDDRATWDRATWQRYLDAATRLEPDYGPPMRRLLQEIDQLTRLIDLPIAA
jgi:hypothetical protein